MALADSSLAAFLRMLTDDPPPDAVAQALAHQPLAKFCPTMVCMCFVDTARDVLTIDGLHGAEPHVRNACASIPLASDMPATACYRSNTVVRCSAAQMTQDFPLTATYADSRHDLQADEWAFPIRYRSAVIAILGLELPGLRRPAVAGPLRGGHTDWAPGDLGRTAHPRRPGDPRVLGTPSPPASTITDRQRRIIALVREGHPTPRSRRTSASPCPP